MRLTGTASHSISLCYRIVFCQKHLGHVPPARPFFRTMPQPPLGAQEAGPATKRDRPPSYEYHANAERGKEKREKAAKAISGWNAPPCYRSPGTGTS